MLLFLDSASDSNIAAVVVVVAVEPGSFLGSRHRLRRAEDMFSSSARYCSSGIVSFSKVHCTHVYVHVLTYTGKIPLSTHPCALST